MIVFSLFLSLDQNLMKQIPNNTQNICSLFTSQIYQLKMKCKDRGSYFYKNKKYRLLHIEKKKKISAISFQKFLILTAIPI